MIFSVAFPVVDIDLGKTRNEQLELLFVEDRNKISGNDIVEPYAFVSYSSRNKVALQLTL